MPRITPDGIQALIRIASVDSFQDYATNLAEQLGLRGPQQAKKLGMDLGEDALEKLRDEQIQQLYELMITATGKVEDSKDSKS